MRKILFLCTGNTCRSPLALAAWRALQNAGRTPDDIEAFSAGLMAREGAPASHHSLAIAQDWGVDLSTHQARPLSSRLLQDISAIFVMTREQQEALQHSFKFDAQKVHLLGSFLPPRSRNEEFEIPDPIGGSHEAYETCAAMIRRAVEGAAAALERGEI